MVIPLMSQLLWRQGCCQIKLITTVHQDTKSTGYLIPSPGQEHEINLGEDMVEMLPENGIAVGGRGFCSRKLFEQFMRNDMSRMREGYAPPLLMLRYETAMFSVVQRKSIRGCLHSQRGYRRFIPLAHWPMQYYEVRRIFRPSCLGISSTVRSGWNFLLPGTKFVKHWWNRKPCGSGGFQVGRRRSSTP